MEERLLRDQLFAFSNGGVDRFLIRHREIPLVAAWLAIHGNVAYDLQLVDIDGETLYEVRRDYVLVQFHVGVLNLMPHLKG